MDEKPKSVFMWYAADEACRMHRLLSPARYLKRDINVRFKASARNEEETSQTFDAYAIHGLPLPESMSRMGVHQSNGKRWVWSIDDNYLQIPPWNPYKLPPEKLAYFEMASRLADDIVVSTPHLAGTFANRPAHVREKVHYARNLIDLSLYPTVKPAPWPERRPFTILWSGSYTHLFDVKQVIGGVRHILQKYARKVPVEFVFFGQAPPDELLTDFLHKGVSWTPGVELGLYWSVVTQMRPHVVLAPLYDCEFNRSKSNIRVLDGWALSAAVIASPVGEYSCIKDGEDGILAENDDGWAMALEWMIEDDAARQRIATAGRKRCEREWDWQSKVARRPWAEMYAKILDVPLPPLVPDPPAVTPEPKAAVALV